MKTEQIIQSIRMWDNPEQTYSVGDEIDGKVVIEIKLAKPAPRTYEHQLLDEDGEIIKAFPVTETLPNFQTIAVDGPPEQ